MATVRKEDGAAAVSGSGFRRIQRMMWTRTAVDTNTANHAGNRTVTATRSGARFQGDTSREARRAQYAALRRTTAAQRLAFMDDLTRLARSMTREGLRRRRPTLAEEELDVRFFDLVLGPRLGGRGPRH
jgi:hypothetical protein